MVAWINIALLAATLLDFSQGAVELVLESENRQIDPGRSVFLDVRLQTAAGLNIAPPDLRDRVRGFSLAEDDAETPEFLKDGRILQVVHWRLVPEPCAKEYKIAPFVVGDKVAGPVYFEPPPPREAVSGDMEIDPRKDMPPINWRFFRRVLAWLAACLIVAAAALWAIRYLARRVKEHRMSPVERAWVELERLLRKGLPGRGKYKDFYVELTQLVRRYVQRQHGVKAPHLTTEEFFEIARASSSFPEDALNELFDFMRKADMIKFAGVEATSETADEATASAKAYISKDDEAVKKRERASGRARQTEGEGDGK